MLRRAVGKHRAAGYNSLCVCHYKRAFSGGTLIVNVNATYLHIANKCEMPLKMVQHAALANNLCSIFLTLYSYIHIHHNLFVLHLIEIFPQ